MRPCQLRSTGQQDRSVTGRRGGYTTWRLSPPQIRFTVANGYRIRTTLWRGVFPPFPAIYRGMCRGRQGRALTGGVKVPTYAKRYLQQADHRTRREYTPARPPSLA